MGIRAKIGLPLAVIIILLGLVSWWLVNGQLLRLTEKSLGQTMQAKAQEVEGSIKASASMALQMAAMTSRLPEVMEAYKIAQTGPMADEKSPESQKAREMLRAALAPVLKGYEAATGQKLQLHYHLPNGRSLVRLWREKQIKRGDAWVDVSDDIAGFRPTVLDVNANKKPVQGIELGRGGFAIRGVVPVAAPDGAHLGSVEVLAEFEQVFKKAASGKGEAVLLFMNADKLAITEALQDAKKFPRLGDGFVRVSSEGALAENATLDPALLESGKRELALRVDEHIATAAFPVKDYKGEQIGVMVYLLDVSEQQGIIGETGRLLLGVLAALLVVPIVFTLFIVSRLVLSPVRAIRGKIQEIAEGKADLKARLNLRQQDEVGALAMWFDRLMAKIEEMLCEVEGYHNLINSVPDPIFAVDDNFNILIANKATEKLLGCDLKELRKSRCADKFRTKFCGTSQCPIEQAKRTNGHFEADIMNIGTDDKPHWIQPSGDILRDCYGQKVGYVEVARNVSDVVRKEQEAQRTMDRLAAVNAEIMDASGRIVDATQEMLERFGQMSDGAGVQRRRVEETATAMEEMNATVLEVAQNASRAAEEAGAAREQAERGAQVVAQSVEAIDAVRNQAQALKANMGELGKRAENIGQILNVISDIADQTNLLALNAAIEAARAGDAGRGFAVVADEVRKLAEKTMQATKEVGQAIHAIQDGARQNATVVDTAAQAVDKATTLAGESGQALRRIVDKVGQTTDQVQAIAAAAEEQSAASEEINRAIMEVSRITADTVSGLESSDGALQQLASLAARLDGLARR